ncbi:hypothetical protein HORIV_56590 [Vreelandella olivaria]|uniref:Uncharacterized protein n=1 Tax=Vreelandella olivaria TaxID=390919 RepID=A0ABM7GR22_9GAMM|nr:hypothetical protein HORIV_56590 [Halomonas olivaria]
MVYLPYGITNNESGFMGRTPIESIADLDGKRLRLSGRDQGRVLEELGGSQVTLAGVKSTKPLSAALSMRVSSPPQVLILTPVLPKWLTTGQRPAGTSRPAYLA